MFSSCLVVRILNRGDNRGTSEQYRCHHEIKRRQDELQIAPSFAAECDVHGPARNEGEQKSESVKRRSHFVSPLLKVYAPPHFLRKGDLTNCVFFSPFAVIQNPAQLQHKSPRASVCAKAHAGFA